MYELEDVFTKRNCQRVNNRKIDLILFVIPAPEREIERVGERQIWRSPPPSPPPPTTPPTSGRL